MLKWIGRVLLGLLIIVVVVIVGVVGFVAYDMNLAPTSASLTNTIIDANGTPINAYIAAPEGEGPFPAVLLIHEWWGLRPDIIEKADRIAEQGYVVMAVDAYRGQTTGAVPTALYMAITYPQETIDADMDAFFAHLQSLDTVDAERIAVMGYCFGGRQATRFAVEHAPDVAALLTYYGGGQLSTEAELAPLSEHDVAVLGVFGETDAQIPLEEVAQFEDALAELDVPHTVTVYPDVGHAFVKDLDSPGASRDAWEQGLAFLDEQLTPSAG